MRLPPFDLCHLRVHQGSPGVAAARHSSSDTLLELEARHFARYLLDHEPPPQCIARYVAAHRTLLPAEPGSADAALPELVRLHPWSLPFLDAATAVLRPQSLLRSKLLLTAAILEASPHSAEALLPRRTAPAALLLRLAGYAVSSACKLVIGAVLLMLATRKPRG